MSTLIVIPARYGSTRFPGKPLLRHSGKYLIEHVYQQAAKARRAAAVVVATDDLRILQAVESFGGQAVMTRSDHPSGTDRIAEVMMQSPFVRYTNVVNVQGDEPEIEPETIDQLAEALSEQVTMATVAAPFENPADRQNPNIVKVVCDQQGRALYFSRSLIPFDRDGIAQNSPELSGLYLKHLGIYAYRREFLLQLAATAPCPLEMLEKLEQLRALYLGGRIQVIRTARAPHGIDTPADYEAFLERLTR